MRQNLAAGLNSGAALEVDLVVTADGHFLCLHDLTLDAETTGTGPIAAATRAEVALLRQRGANGDVLDEPPLFLDEVVASVSRLGQDSGGLTQIDIKEPQVRFDEALLMKFAGILRPLRHRFIASGCDAMLIQHLRKAAPDITFGFDPLDHYDLDGLHNAGDFEALADDTLRLAPGAAVYYLEADLVLKGIDLGVSLVERLTGNGAEIDAWTVDADQPGLRQVLQRLIGAGVHQITTNDPDELEIFLQEMA